MVARGGKPGVTQQVAGLLDGPAACAVDNARAPGPLPHEGKQRPVLLGAPPRVLHGKAQVGPVEARHHREGVDKAQRAGDVLADGPGCRGGERHHGRPRGQAVDEAEDALVGGPEVVSPLGDAVRLVHGQERHPAAARHLQEARVVQALGRHVEEGHGAGRHAVQDVRLLGGAERGVEAARGNAVLAQASHLVLHERDERAHHHREASSALGQDERRHLVADGLSGRGGHDGKDVAAGKGRLDDLLLVGAEAFVAKRLAQDVKRLPPRALLCLVVA